MHRTTVDDASANLTTSGAGLESLEEALHRVLHQSHADLRTIFQQADDARQEAIEAKRRYDELSATIQSRFDRAASLSSRAAGNEGSRSIGFNVSGTIFVLNRDVVACISDSVLSALVSNTFPVDVDQDGHILVDRSPEPFAHIATYLKLRWDGLQGSPDSPAAVRERRTTVEPTTSSSPDTVHRVERMLRGLGVDELALLRDEAHFFALDELCLLCTHAQQQKFLLHYPFTATGSVGEGLLRVGDAGNGRILCVDVLSENSAGQPNDGITACATSRWWLACAGTEAGSLIFLSRPPLRAEIRRMAHADAVTAVLWMGNWPSTTAEMSSGRRSPSDRRSSSPSVPSAMMALLSAGRDDCLRVTVVDALDVLPTSVVAEFNCPSNLGAPTSLAAQSDDPRKMRLGGAEHASVFRFFSGHATGAVGCWRCTLGEASLGDGSTSNCIQLLRTVETLSGGDGMSIRKVLVPPRHTFGGGTNRHNDRSRRNDCETLLCVQGTLVERIAVTTGLPIGAPLDAHVQSVRCVVANQLLLATGCFAGNVFLWDLAVCCTPTTSACAPSPRIALPPFASWIADMQFTKNVRPHDSLLCVSAGDTLSIAHPWSGSLLRTVCLAPAHLDVVRCLFALDGGLGIVTGSFDGSLIFWDGDAPDGCPLCCAPGGR